jgi:dTDP-glucose 4,6-dehydratase
MTRVLLTGASGFVGSHILEHLLLNTDWQFVCLAAWKHKGTPERIERAMRDNKDRVTVITHDLVSPLTEHTVNRLGKIDYILNVAAESHVNRSIDEPVRFVENNVHIALTMLELARKLQPSKFLQFSTDEVYGVAPEGVNHKEWSSIIPSNPYSASKAAQEAIAISYWRTYGVPLIITNTMNIFGETQDGEKYIAQLIRKISNEEIVTVHGNENNIGSRYYLHARNCADAILFIVKNIEPRLYSDSSEVLVPERFNIVGDVELNNLEVANMVAKILGKPLKYELVDFHKGRPGHDRRYALDGTKLREAGWAAPMSFEQSLEKYIAWTLKHKEWLL